MTNTHRIPSLMHLILEEEEIKKDIAELDDAVKDAFSGMDNELKALQATIAKEIESKASLNEEGVTLAIGIGLAIPHVLHLASKGLAKLDKKKKADLQDMPEKGTSGYEAWSKRLGEWSKKLHGWYIGGIKIALWPVFKMSSTPKDKQEKICDLVLNGLIATFLLISGQGLVAAAAEGSYATAGLELFVGAVKTDEVKDIIMKHIKGELGGDHH